MRPRDAGLLHHLFAELLKVRTGIDMSPVAYKGGVPAITDVVAGPGLTGGGPADLTHVLATLGVRYLRYDQIEQSMAAIVTALPLVLPLVYILMRRLK